MPADLRWYFTRTAVGPLRSNFPGMVQRLNMGRARGEAIAEGDEEQLLEAAARSGGIARVLRALDPDSAEVLWRSYSAEWPEEYALLGDLAGLAPMTEAASKAYRLIGRKRATFEEWLRELFAAQDSPRAMPTLMRIAVEARGMRRRALVAYLAARRRVGRRA